MNILFIANINSVHTYGFVKEFARRGHLIFILSIAQNKKQIDYENLGTEIDLKWSPNIPVLNIFKIFTLSLFFFAY